MKGIEYKLTWPRRDRAEDQHQRFNSEVSMENKIIKLTKAGYKDIQIWTREVERDEWKKRE